MLVHLDQNYASRIAKHLLGQASHAHFGQVLEALRSAGACAPASPFHVLETRGGYLLPTLQRLFEEVACGWWSRPWQEVVRRQAARGELDRADLLTRTGDWETPATLEPLQDLLGLPLAGAPYRRRRTLRSAIAERLALPTDVAAGVPFVDLLARLVAFRSLDEGRAQRPSDLTDLLMAATVTPYVDALATDRYLAEMLRRVGHGGPVFSGRRPDVLRMAAWLGAAAEGGGPPRPPAGQSPRR
jgi:hypothetical protein